LIAGLIWPAIFLPPAFAHFVRPGFFVVSQLQASLRRSPTKKPLAFAKGIFLIVGMTRFELAASSSRTKRATGLRYIPSGHKNKEFRFFNSISRAPISNFTTF
jgi:hypothetical protein